MNHVPMKSNKIVNDPIDNNRRRASKIRIAFLELFIIRHFSQNYPELHFSSTVRDLGLAKRRRNGEVNSW